MIASRGLLSSHGIGPRESGSLKRERWGLRITSSISPGKAFTGDALGCRSAITGSRVAPPPNLLAHQVVTLIAGQFVRLFLCSDLCDCDGVRGFFLFRNSFPTPVCLTSKLTDRKELTQSPPLRDFSVVAILPSLGSKGSKQSRQYVLSQCMQCVNV